MESWFREHIDPHILTVLLVWLMMGMMLTMGTADLAGQVLAGRYRLLHALGAGAGGRTYVAQDTQLGRRVAVKVLHEALAGDVTFLARFRAEARAVASLSHPNIVTLHDWGDGPVPFMVLELLGGGSLAALLASGRRLSAAQAARLGSDVAAGLEHAHGQGLVHRDVKPGNLLLDDRGTVKIADFGLARALAESGATEPAGGVVGTARYVTPEQATADPLDGRADLYALGLVLVEAVTGEVPLTGETPIATLLMRAATPIEAPVELGALGVAVERAGLPTPVERYPDAAAMGRALAAAATMLPEPEPLELPGLGVDLDEPVPTEIVVTRRPDRPTEALVAEELGDTGEQALGLADDAAPADAAPAAEHRRGRLLVPWVVGVVAGLAFAGAAWAVTEARGPLAHAPNVVGATEDDAAAALTRSGLSLDVVERVHAPDPAGTVLSQDPTAGGTLRRGGDVELVVSSGAPPVALPAVTGQEEGPAVEALAAAGFEVAVEHRYDDGVPAGAVILQEPSASEAPEGSAVTIVVSRGPEPVVLPNVVGKPREAAVAALDEARFNVVAVEEFSDTVDAGSVIRQDPVGGAEAVPGSQVKIVVSKGPNRVLIPDVKGLTVEEATRKIEAAGLKADVIGYKPGGLVKRQDPEGGLMLERGRTVTLFV